MGCPSGSDLDGLVVDIVDGIAEPDEMAESLPIIGLLLELLPIKMMMSRSHFLLL